MGEKTAKHTHMGTHANGIFSDVVMIVLITTLA